MNELSISAVGDISIGDHPICVGHGMRYVFETHGDVVLEAAKGYLSGSDVVIGNLETVASDIGHNHNDLESCEMRGQPESLKYLKEAGFSVLSVANNHVMQHGIEAFNDTILNLAKYNFEVIGLDYKKKTVPYIFKKNDKIHAFIAFSFRPEEHFNGEVPYSLRDVDDTENFIDELREIKKSIDGFLIVSVHWGLEFLHLPGQSQVLLAHKIVDSGADLILGHHSHFLQPVERYKRALIFYSLGNFIFDMCHPRTKLSSVVRIKLDESGSHSYQIHPMHISRYFILSEASGNLKREISNLLTYKDSAFHKIMSESTESYISKYKKEKNNNRYYMYSYFFMNLFRYKYIISFQMVKRMFSRRIKNLIG